MTFLPSDELDALRSDLTELLPDTATIQRAALTNTKGAWSESFSTQATVACRIDPYVRADNSGMMAEGESGRNFYLVSMAYDADVQDGDRIVINSVTYEVIQMHNKQSKRLATRVIVAELNT